MYSLCNTAEAVGFPIRRSPGKSLLTANRGLSQRATSFIAALSQRIHKMPLLCLSLNSMYINYPVHYYLIITLGRVIILYSARCTNIIDNNNNISVYILTSLQFQTAHNHHKMMNDSFSFLTLIISVIYSDVNLFGGGERDRTDDLLLAKQALSQLSYTPINYF